MIKNDLFLRALNNDMKRNLIEPLREITSVAKELGYEIPEIRVAVRTSDTKSYEKQRMVKIPPHILITTPESFSIALVAPRFREKLTDHNIVYTIDFKIFTFNWIRNNDFLSVRSSILCICIF